MRLVQANGRIEDDHCTVAGKIAGKIIELKAREGDEVKKGQVLAKLDDAQINAKVLQAKKGGGLRLMHYAVQLRYLSNKVNVIRFAYKTCNINIQ